MTTLIQSVFILIAALLSTTVANMLVYKQLGETASLKPPPGFNLQGYFHWYYGDLEIAWFNDFGGNGLNTEEKDAHKMVNWKDNLAWSGNSLLVKDIQEHHFGTFYLKKVHTVQQYTNVAVLELLKLEVRITPGVPLLPGDFLSLTCKAQGPQVNKPPQIHWLNPRRERMEINRGQLKVRVTGQDDGQWTCVVANDKDETQANISVKVVDLSPASSRPQYASKSSRFTIPCAIRPHISWEQIKAKGIEGVHWDFFPSLVSSDPQRLYSLSMGDQLTWKPIQSRGLTPVSDPKTGNLSLTKNQANEDDRGDYVCTLKFSNGVTLNRTVHVNVLQITSSPGTDLISGQQLNLTCSLGRPLPPDLRLKWLLPEQSSLTLTPDHHPARLNIPEVGTGDGGKWRCELWQSNIRLTSAVITLKIEPKLSVWMLVIICSVTVIIFLLLLLVFILCRRRQRKMRLPRHRLCHCKNPKPKGFYRT